MKDLIYNVFSLSCLFSVACALITDKRFERVLRLSFSVIFSSVIFLSVAQMLSGGVPIPEYTAPDVSAQPSPFEEVLREASREGLVRSLCSEFSINEEDIEIVLGELQTGEMFPHEVTVTLKGKAALADYRAIEEFLYEGGYRSVRIKLSLDS